MAAPVVYTDSEGDSFHSYYGKSIEGLAGKKIVAAEIDDYLGMIYIDLDDGTTLVFKAAMEAYGHGDTGAVVRLERR
jgi:hypothetical protein